MFTNWGRGREQGLGAGGPRGHTEKHSHAKTRGGMCTPARTHTHTHTHTPQGHTEALTDPETCPGHLQELVGQTQTCRHTRG